MSDRKNDIEKRDPLNLDRFPRVRLAHLPTPIEPLARLSAYLGGPAIYVKRDDCTGGMAQGGNKTRKLEFVIAEALAAGADTVVTMGGMQSNHARQTAAAAARVGISSVLILNQSAHDNQNYLVSGNVLIDRLLDAQIHIVPVNEDPNEVCQRILADLAIAGRKTFFVPSGASTPVGALGYAIAAAEIVDWCSLTGLKPDRIVVTAGSGGTQAGLLVGFHALGSPIPVLGIGLTGGRDSQEEARVWSLVQETATLIGGFPRPARTDVVVDCSYGGTGYATVNNMTLEAMRLVARLEALILDPVYTGVAMAGLIGTIRKRRFVQDEIVLFVHTGGTPGLFGYIDRMVDRIATGSRI